MDDERYIVESTSNVTSVVRDIPISESAKGLTRKVLRSELIENTSEPENSVRLCLVHQRRSSADVDWTDLNSTTLAQTKPLTPSKFQLDSAETRQLFRHLANLYQVGEGGVPSGRVVLQLADEEEVIRTDASRAAIIRRLLEANHGEEVWELLLELHPGLAEKLTTALTHDKRRQAVETFEAAIAESHNEEFWRSFLRDNTWMFGGSNVALVGESRIDIKNIADLPFVVEGGFMDVVELKRPDTHFWLLNSKGKTWLYRDKYPVPHHELTGAVAQAENYILQAEKHVSDSDFIESHGVRPLKPRGLVVHGRSCDWGDTEWTAFRLLNDGLHGVQVMTFDHLLAQARRAIEL